jgi:hypothetical protein
MYRTWNSSIGGRIMLEQLDKDIQNGTICRNCGCIMEDLIDDVRKTWVDGPGYPRLCDDCKKILGEE